MSKLEVFQNGVFSDTGLPVYQIGTINEDGTYTTTVYALMNEEQAKAKLQELQPATKAEAKPKTKAKSALKAPSKSDLNTMTKLEIEEELRLHGLELDRRKSKSALVDEAVAFLKGK